MIRLIMSVLLAGLLGLAGPVQAASQEDDDAPKAWQETTFEWPAANRVVQWQPFYVSAVTDYRFAVDLNALTVGEDGVVRYVLLAESAEGARNVSFEGMRCESREYRIYATGRRDGTWSKSRNERWERIRDAVSNRQHAALFLEYFCPGGVIVRHAEEAREALRRGAHPANQRW